MISICLELSEVCSAGHFTDYKILSIGHTPWSTYLWDMITGNTLVILCIARFINQTTVTVNK